MISYGPDDMFRVAYTETTIAVSYPRQQMTVQDNVTVEQFSTEGDARQRVADTGREWPT